MGSFSARVSAQIDEQKLYLSNFGGGELLYRAYCPLMTYLPHCPVAPHIAHSRTPSLSSPSTPIWTASCSPSHGYHTHTLYRGNMVYEYMWGSQECTTCCARMCYSCIHACVIHVSVRYVCVSYSCVIPVCVIHVICFIHVYMCYSCMCYPCMCYIRVIPVCDSHVCVTVIHVCHSFIVLFM